MKNNLSIAILIWWTGLEREIAIKSSLTFSEFLEKADYYVLPDNIDTFLNNYKKYDLVIPIFHWEYGEDWKIFWLLESLWIKYLFSSSNVHSICIDKYLTSVLLQKIWILSPKSEVLFNINDIFKAENLNYPLIVKPNKWWSSFATYKVNNYDELVSSLNSLFSITNDAAIVQEFIYWTEYSVSIVWSWNNVRILPIMILKLEWVEFFDYNQKYNYDWENEFFNELDEVLKNELEELSLKIYNYLWCKTMSRIDFIVNNEWIYFIEVNTIPGFTNKSILPKAWINSWLDIKQLIKFLINDGIDN